MLRDVVETDLPIFYEQQLDPMSTRMAAFPPREEWSVFLAHWKTKVLADPANCAQTIVWNERVAGYIASWSQEERRLIAYWIGREYWGRGIATAALAEFLGYERARPLARRWGALPTSIPPRLEAQSTRRPGGDVARRPAMIGRGREGRMVRREGIEPSTCATFTSITPKCQ
jgi:hypothetical protein